MCIAAMILSSKEAVSWEVADYFKVTEPTNFSVTALCYMFILNVNLIQNNGGWWSHYFGPFQAFSQLLSPTLPSWGVWLGEGRNYCNGEVSVTINVSLS